MNRRDLVIVISDDDFQSGKNKKKDGTRGQMPRACKAEACKSRLEALSNQSSSIAPKRARTSKRRKDSSDEDDEETMEEGLETSGQVQMCMNHPLRRRDLEKLLR
eukprot:TRINITY_DN57500_c0_g1_i1.p2 TRINITY_DN57500_c0_g1~~TRINITY_DN57500_c0_g1_i1.p2  ORF type:complete len:105 (+),score=22.22 TRINITY_DN57500_c0_g1_i1:56-370(+)